MKFDMVFVFTNVKNFLIKNFEKFLILQNYPFLKARIKYFREEKNNSQKRNILISNLPFFKLI